MKGAYIFLADGFEDIEALGTLDILRRGGIPSTTVTINETPEVTSAHGVTVLSECLLDEFLDEGADLEDILIFPGGLPGASNLAECKPLIAYARTHFQHVVLGLHVSKLNNLPHDIIVYQEILPKRVLGIQTVPLQHLTRSRWRGIRRKAIALIASHGVFLYRPGYPGDRVRV